MIHRVYAILLLVAAFGFLSFSSAAQNANYQSYILNSHGVSIAPSDLASFLEYGWRAAKPPTPLPQEPASKSALLGLAWSALSRRYSDIANDPALMRRLGDLALRYATGDLPEGARRVVEGDLRAMSDTNEAQTRETLYEFMRFDGMVALGFFGGRDDATRAKAREILDAEKRPLIRIAHIRSLAMLGDNAVLELLIDEVCKANRTSSVAAARALEKIVGRNFRYHAEMSIGRRIEAAQGVLEWWEENRADILYAPSDRAVVVERMNAAEPPRAPSLRSLEDFLRASADKADIGNVRGSRTAQEFLEQSGAALADKLEPFIKNPDTDLDVRGEAIRWYVKWKGPTEFRKKFRSLTKDPNPEIARQAREILDGKDSGAKR